MAGWCTICFSASPSHLGKAAAITPLPRVYAPLSRVVVLLRYLTDRPGAVVTEGDLVEVLSAHFGVTVSRRTVRGDLQALRRRRLVETDLPHPDHDHLRGTRRSALVEKTEDLMLSVDEHDALQAARQVLGGRQPGVTPTSGTAPSASRENARVEDALLLVRLLEETPEALTVGDAARALGVGAQQAARWLYEVAVAFGDDLVEMDIPERDDVGWRDLRTVELRRFRRPGASHLRATGADLLGLFPYGRAEVHERLVLIDDARRTGGLDDHDLVALESAERKLRAWADLL